MLTLAFDPFSPSGMILTAIVLLLIFGRRLPEVGKNLGKGIVEFKKGLSGIEDDVTKSSNSTPPPAQQQQQQPAITQQPQRQLSAPPNAVSHGSQAQPTQAVQAGGVATDPNSAHQG